MHEKNGKQLESAWLEVLCMRSLVQCLVKGAHKMVTQLMSKIQGLKGVIGLPRWYSGKEPTCQCRRCKRRGFDPWLGKISWRRKWQPTPVFLPGKSHGQRSLVATVHGAAKSWTRLSTAQSTEQRCDQSLD